MLKKQKLLDANSHSHLIEARKVNVIDCNDGVGYDLGKGSWVLGLHSESLTYEKYHEQ